MKKGKIASVLLALLLVFSSFGMAFAAPDDGAKTVSVPADVVGKACEGAVEELMNLGIVNGYPDGTYQPDRPVTRAEMTKLIIGALDMDDDGIAVYGNTFSDGKKNWTKNEIGYAEHLGLVKGYLDHTFKPGDDVSYDEANAMILRALGYTDRSLVGTWPANYREKAIGQKIATKNMTGKSPVTRGNVAILIDNALNLPIGRVDDKGTWTAKDRDTMKSRLMAEPPKENGERIPYSARLIHEYGLGGAVTDKAPDITKSPYYEEPDFYDLTSGGTLTMLTHFKTIQQATGWTCGPSSALMVLEWYGKRGDLNEMDLASLRNKPPGGATTLKGMLSIFDGLQAKLDQKWNVLSSYDLKEDKDGVLTLEVEKGKVLPIEEAIPYFIEKGEPIIVGSQSWAGHYQVVIGYDTMGTEETQDDVLILADPFDTTDHRQDGYIVQSYERFIYDWSSEFDPDFTDHIFLVPVPEGYHYSGPSMGKGLQADGENHGNFSDIQVIPYNDRLKEMLAVFAKSYQHPIEIGENGLSGPADSAYYRKGDHDLSPYYKLIDGYNLKSSDTLTLLQRFKTTQQVTEYTCGQATLEMVLEYYGKLGNLNEIDLANMRDKKDDLPGTTVQEMLNMIKNLDGHWNVVSSYDMVKGDSELGSGVTIDGNYMDLSEMIPYYLEKGIPIMVMWHEWGGHWQAIIGYDTMGTKETQDDVLILADPYDTTDHNQDGYVIQSYERFIYDWGNSYDKAMPWGAFTVISPVD